MSLGELILSLADNKQLLGLRYAEWATRAPSLEADIASAARADAFFDQEPLVRA